jgi:hypothetical protein
MDEDGGGRVNNQFTNGYVEGTDDIPQSNTSGPFCIFFLFIAQT